MITSLFNKLYLLRLLAVLVAFWWTATLSGCLLLLGAGAGAGGAVYVMGKLEEEMDGSVPALRRASVAALKYLDMPIIKDKGDKLTAEVKSQTASDQPVWINIKSVTRSRSKVSIRVGYVGDEARSRRILEAIRKRV